MRSKKEDQGFIESTVSEGDNSLTLSLNTEETRVVVTFVEGKADEFVVIMEDSQRNVCDDKMIFSLAEGLRAGRRVDTLPVVGFKEGDQIILRDGTEKISLLVKSVQRNVLDNEGNLMDAPEFILECVQI